MPTDNQPIPNGIKREERFVVSGIDFKTLEAAIAYQQIAKKESEASDYLNIQGELFDKKLLELLPKYEGMYVFFENGEVKDADDDEEVLIERVLEKEGYRDIFVEKVTEPTTRRLIERV
jgi:malonyl CoA-acyl carrier protein transacylase